MGDVITGEIDLRPSWRQFAREQPARKPAPRTSSEITSFTPAKKKPSQAMIAGAAGGVLLLVLMFAFGGSETPPRPPPAAPPPPVPALAIAPPEQPPPIVIEATPENLVTPQPAKPVAGFGTLELESDPSVVVFEGKRRLGRTPLKIKLSAGRHDLELVNRAKHLKEKRRIDIRANQTHKRELSFGVGALKVDAPEGTKMYLNSRYFGTAPFAKLALAEGRHHLKLQHAGHVESRWIEVPASHTVDYRVSFPD